jgi:geranylgeranyl reductase family protein
MIRVAIVGGGPAGAYCAYSLAENGVSAVIFDHTHPREKPCGGLISPLAQEMFPFLKTIPIKHSERSRVYLVTSSGNRACIHLRKSKVLGFSRLKLDQYLINMALDKGAELINEKVVAFERKNNSWKVKTTNQVCTAENLVGADGVNSLVRRKIVGPLCKMDKGICCGYLVKGLEKEDITIRLLVHRKGFMWVIPRNDHTSLGIGTAEASRSYGLRQELDMFIEQQYPHVEKISQWAALIPNIKNVKTFQIPIAGPNWMLIGDSAGHVNPILGEGIIYALLDGELAAQAIVEDNPELFNELWIEAYGSSLSMQVKIRKWLYTKVGAELYCKLLKLQNSLNLWPIRY